MIRGEGSGGEGARNHTPSPLHDEPTLKTVKRLQQMRREKRLGLGADVIGHAIERARHRAADCADGVTEFLCANAITFPNTGGHVSSRAATTSKERRTNGLTKIVSITDVQRLKQFGRSKFCAFEYQQNPFQHLINWWGDWGHDWGRDWGRD